MHLWTVWMGLSGCAIETDLGQAERPPVEVPESFQASIDGDRIRASLGAEHHVLVKVPRSGGFNGEVEVELLGLPLGVRSTPTTIPPAGNQTNLTLDVAAGSVMGGPYQVVLVARGAGLTEVTEVPLYVTGPAGTLDESFGDGGIVTLPVAGAPHQIAVDNLDRILVGGSEGLSSGAQRDWFVRLHPEDGSLDSTFGIEGIVETGGQGSFTFSVQPDDSLLVLGTPATGSAHLRSIDATGQRPTEGAFASQVVFDPEALEHGAALAHQALLLNRDRLGVIGNDGILRDAPVHRDVLPDWLEQAQPGPGRNTTLAGEVEGGLRVVRLNPYGDPDPTFGTDGTTHALGRTSEAGFSVADLELDNEGGGVAVFYTPDFRQAGLFRFRPDGLRDVDFGDQGIAFPLPDATFVPFLDAAIQSDGRVVVWAELGEEVRLIRLQQTGQLDPDFQAAAGLRRFDTLAAVAVDRSGDRLLVALQERDGPFVVIRRMWL